MKKFNAKKVIVVGAVGLLFLGGTVAAAGSTLKKWQGENTTDAVEANLVTINDMLESNEKKISFLNDTNSALVNRVGELSTQIIGLDGVVERLNTELGLSGDDNADLLKKIEALDGKITTNNAEVNALLKEAEGYLKIEPIANDSATVRYGRIKVKATALYNEKVQAEKKLADAKKSIDALTAEQVKLSSDLKIKENKNEDLQLQLNEAEKDVKSLKEQSDLIIREHSTPTTTATTN